MAFTTEYLADPSRVGAGERWGNNNIVLTSRDFEDGLVVGRFAKLDSGSIDNMDGSSSPVLAGVVMRHATSPVEQTTVDADLYDQVEYVRAGLVTVRIKDGETPAQFGTVYVSNAGDADDGLATATNSDIEASAEFIEEVKTDVWLIRLL